MSLLSLLLSFFSTLCFINILIRPCSFAKHSSGRSSRKAYYGSPCNSSVKCDIHSLLMCEENVCQCLYPDAMIYNSDLGTCVSLVNEICGYLETKGVFITCVPHANCDQQQGVCKCTQGYVQGDRHCLRQKSYGESCHSDNECLSELSLTCFEEVCQCDPKIQAPHRIKNDLRNGQEHSASRPATKCVALAGLPCTAKTGCVEKATCVSETENEALVSNSAFGWMQTGVCKCDNGYEIDESSHCRGKYGSYCDVLANISCVEKFHCLDGICQCNYFDDQVFRREIGECVSLVGGPCTEANGNDDDSNGAMDEEEISCDKFMECKNQTCTCKNGFVENLGRGCDLGYMVSCTGETISKCDAAVGLHCIDGRCTCKDKRKEFDRKNGRCVGKTGSSCKVPLAMTTGNVISNPAIDDRVLPCSEKMKCQTSRTQLEGIASTGFCTPTKGGDGNSKIQTPTVSGTRYHHDVNDGNSQEVNDEEGDY